MFFRQTLSSTGLITKCSKGRHLTGKCHQLWVSREDKWRMMTSQALTTALPVLPPLNSEMKALGMFSNPSVMVSLYCSLPCVTLHQELRQNQRAVAGSDTQTLSLCVSTCLCECTCVCLCLCVCARARARACLCLCILWCSEHYYRGFTKIVRHPTSDKFSLAFQSAYNSSNFRNSLL